MMTERKRKWVMAVSAVILSAMLTACVWRTETVSAKMETAQKHMAEEVLRFHVLANSDSKEDQELKMTVKDELYPGSKQRWTVIAWKRPRTLSEAI